MTSHADDASAKSGGGLEEERARVAQETEAGKASVLRRAKFFAQAIDELGAPSSPHKAESHAEAWCRAAKAEAARADSSSTWTFVASPGSTARAAADKVLNKQGPAAVTTNISPPNKAQVSPGVAAFHDAAMFEEHEHVSCLLNPLSPLHKRTRLLRRRGESDSIAPTFRNATDARVY